MPASLVDQIEKFESLLKEMRAEIRVGHALLKDIRAERKLIEELLRGGEVSKMVHDRTSEVVKAELDKIGPEIRNQTNLIYAKVGTEIDTLINISLGEPFTKRNGGRDLRPILAEKLKEWLREIVEEGT